MAMDLRKRAAIGVAGMVVLAGCAKGAETVMDSVSSVASTAKADRILAKAPGTWVCTNRTIRSGSDSSVRIGTDRLVVTVYDDNRYAYTKWGSGGDRVEYDGYGSWTLTDGVLELRTDYENRNDRGYRLTGVRDDATELLFEDIEYRTNGSRIPDDPAAPFPVKIVDDDHIEFDVGRGQVWACRRDASDTTATYPGSVPTETVKKVGEIIGKVNVVPPLGEKDRKPSIRVAAADDDLGAQYSPTLEDDGSFSLEVTPGRYRVALEDPPFDDPPPFDCTSAEITVADGGSERVTLDCTPAP